ncbi:hypothetical protein KAH55_02650, partial [bacterium]|nr:hypothetical protein [bacterium]
ADELIAALEAEDIPARISRRTERGVICQRHSPLHESAAFKNKLFGFLDESDELLLELILPYIGRHNTIANNLIPFFSSALKDLCQYETKLSNVVNGSASTPESAPEFISLAFPDLRKNSALTTSHLFDSVILIANDSQSGFMAQNPSLKNTISPDFVKKNGAANHQQLDFCAPLVKNGGYLIFSSHSVLPVETDLIISDFLSRHPEFESQMLQDELLKNYKRTCFTPYGFSTAPYAKQMNGVFLSVMQKKDKKAT